MKSNYLLRVITLLVLMVSLFPSQAAAALTTRTIPPTDMFQLPWDQGIAWVAIDGIDNGTKRPLSSSHNYAVGGAIDFAPKSTMVTGENTSTYWVAAAAAGTVIEISSCHMKIAHASGWLTEYQFLGNIQVKLGDAVARNQRLGIIADGVRYRYCPGSQEINVPHLHFMLRPSIIGASFAGWEISYSRLFNSTKFTKNGSTVGLFKPLLNGFDSPTTPTATGTLTTPASTGTPATATPTGTPATATPTGATPTGATPTGTLATSTPTPDMSPTPTIVGPYVSTSINPRAINVGESSLVTVSLNNVPPEGYTSAEFTCSYNAGLFQVGGITLTSLFGPDPASAISGSKTQSFIVAIAGSNGNKAATSGPAFTFNVNGIEGGQTVIECRARVSQGHDTLTEIPFAVDYITIVGSTSTPDLTPSFTPTPYTLTPAPITPTISPTMCNQAELTGYIEVAPGTVMSPAQGFVQRWGLRNIGSCTWTPAYQLTFSGGEQMNAPQFVHVPYDVAPGQLINLSVDFIAPATPGQHISLWKLRDTTGALFGTGAAATDPLVLDITVSGITPSITPFPPNNGWLTFTDSTFGFQFQYPGQSIVDPGGTDGFTRIYLPIVPGTNLGHKYLEMIARANTGTCQSPLATESMLQTSENVVINGISFLKQTGGDATAGHMNTWTAYSAARDTACVSMDFILRAANPGNFATPVPIFDEAAESAVFGQIMATYSWLALPSTLTPTPTFEFTPNPTLTLTPLPTSTPVPGLAGTVTGQVLASKFVTIVLFNLDNSVAQTLTANSDGTFSLTSTAGTYNLVATSSGFLSAQGSVTITAADTVTKPLISLPAGDIDNNNVINQFDVLTIGMSYNGSTPAAADLNNDGIINVLDLELLAKNYLKSGAMIWE